MNLLQDILTYIRRIVKTPSNAALTDNLLIDYVNRFWIMDVDARIQLFDLKTKYQFQTIPGVDKYNMPLYDVQIQPGSQTIGTYPVYQGFFDPVYINGVRVSFQTQKNQFFNIFPNITQNLGQVAIGDGRNPPTYTINLPILPQFFPPVNPPTQSIIRGHVDITGIIALGLNEDPPIFTSGSAQLSIPAVPTTSVESAFWLTSTDQYGNPIVVCDSGQFLEGAYNYGLLMNPGQAPFGNTPLGPYSLTENTINYLSGVVNVTFPDVIPAGQYIFSQCYYFQTGLPRAVLYYNNCITLRSPPDNAYLVELDAYLTPAAFLNTGAAIPFGYMAEYIARGAARKILSDTGNSEEFAFYEPLFREQEMLVWKRSQRQFTANRTETIYSQGMNNSFGNSNLGAGGQTI